MKLRRLPLALVFFTTIGSLSAANIIFDNGAGNNDWNNAVNWAGDAFPTSADTARVGGGRTANLSAASAFTAQIIQIGFNTGTGTFNVSSGASVTTGASLQIGAVAAGGDAVGVVNQSGGVVNAGGAIILGNTTSGNRGIYNLTSGTLSSTAGGLTLGNVAGAIGEFNVSSPATVRAANFNINATSTIKFTLGATSSADFDITGAMTITSGAKLVIDASAFTLLNTPITLIDSTTGAPNVGTFQPGDITFVGVNPSFTPTISYSGGDLIFTVVPEPSVSVLAAAGLATAFFFRRRSVTDQ